MRVHVKARGGRGRVRRASNADHLQLGQAQQAARIVDFLARTLTRELVVLTQEGRQSEGLQVVGEQNLGCLAHEPAPAIRLK